MEDLFFQLTNVESYLLFFLVLIRISGFLQTLPLFSSNLISQTVKIFIAIILSVFFYKYLSTNNVQQIAQLQFNNPWDYLIIAFRELIIGVLLGILPRIVFFAIVVAADLISNVIGLSYANIYNPQDNSPSTSLGLLLESLAILIFLSMGWHQYLITYIYNSYDAIGLFEFSLANLSYITVLTLVQQIFVIGIIFASPILTIAVIINIGLGFANRTIIQLNVFIVGSLLLLFVGLLFFALLMPFYANSLQIHWFDIQQKIQQLLTELRG